MSESVLFDDLLNRDLGLLARVTFKEFLNWMHDFVSEAIYLRIIILCGFLEK